MARKVKRKPTRKVGPPKTSLAFQDDQALMGGDPGARDHLLDQMAKMGSKWVRANVAYGKTAGGTDLHELDSLVDAAKARGIKVQATLMSDPRYAEQKAGNLSYNNNDPKLWAQFAKNVASREKGRVGRYSVGNEMNFPAFNAGSDTDPRKAGRAYRGIYRAGYDAIKAADKGNQVLAGELVGTGGDPKEFLKGFLSGKRINTAGLAYHPYERPGVKWDINHLDDIQKTLASYKRQGKLQTATGKQAPLFLTEMGYMRGNMDEGQRIKLAAAAYAKAKKAGAHEYLQYQLTQKDTDTGDAGDPGAEGDMYTPGRTGRPARAAAGAWDTSVGSADGDLGQFARALRAGVRSKPRAKVRRR